ncbi:MAG: 3-deoxy-D-manno-octulosonic acid transferase [Ostreibacterium sp.]
MNTIKNYATHLFYNVVLTLLLPFFILRLLWKSRKNTHYRHRINERLALQLPNIKPDIFIHTVSVGEFLATLPLIETLLEHKQVLLITTTTPTGSNLVKEKLGNRVLHCYLPFDLPFITTYFINKTQPKLAVFVETEIWPNFIQSLKKSNIPVLLINARLSEKSYQRYKILGEFIKNTMGTLTEIICQNELSQQRFKKLGAKTSLYGNLKFDLSPPADLADKQLALNIKFNHRPFILVASTHKGEDEQILTAFKNSHYANTHLLVIAPRHPDRVADVISLCQKYDYSTECYTKIVTKINQQTHVLLIDTLGKLLYFYALAEFAIIGGSFVPHGGHNPLEAALFSTPCLIGKHYFNFETLINDMLAENAIIVSESDQLFNTDYPFHTIGSNAAQFLARNQGALQRYTQTILSYI